MTIRNLILTLTLCLLSPVAATAQTADDESSSGGWGIAEWRLHTSVYTWHFDPEPEHVNSQKLLGVETLFENDWLAGFAAFDNSFGQNSQIVYMGKSWAIAGSDYWYFKLTGGLLHGYKEPYEDKIPLNDLGVAPAIIPALGFRYRRVIAEANLGGLAVIMFTIGVAF